MSIRVPLPGAGGCVLARAHASPVYSSSRVLLSIGDGVFRLHWRQEFRGSGRSSSVSVHCVASDASVELKDSAASPKDSADENVSEVKESAESTGPAASVEVKDSAEDAGSDTASEEGEKSAGDATSEAVSAEAPENAEAPAESEVAGGGKDRDASSKRSWESYQNIRDKRTQDWKRAESFMDKQGVFQGRIEAYNQGGLVLRFYSLRGFLPFSQLSLARLPRDSSKTVVDVGKELIGKTVPVMVIQADKKNRKLVFSERKALWAQFGSKIQLGSVLVGQVTGVVDYGAFVDIRFPDGTYPAVGLVHVKEIAWDVVTNPRDVLTIGQDVKVKVIGIDNESMRLALSIRQLEPDPLMETLDTLMPTKEAALAEAASVDSSESVEMLLKAPLPGIDEICKELEKETGITAVSLGRQKVEKHVVSQDLELWLSQGPVEAGQFTLLARAGRQVQEVNVTTSLGREEMKVAVKRVTQKLS